MEKGQNKYYLYRHIRLDTNEVFYIGIGTKSNSNRHHPYSRSKSKQGRNKIWKAIVNKNKDYIIEIIMEFDDYNLVKEKEKEFIALYGRKVLGKGTLCNLTDGGDGLLGTTRTEEWKNNISKSNTGNTWLIGYKHTEESKKNMSDSAIKRGVSNKCREAQKAAAERGEFKNKLGKYQKSEEQKRKISESLKGRKLSPETLAKRSATTKGRKSPLEGRKTQTEESKQKIREAVINRWKILKELKTKSSKN